MINRFHASYQKSYKRERPNFLNYKNEKLLFDLIDNELINKNMDIKTIKEVINSETENKLTAYTVGVIANYYYYYKSMWSV